METVFGVLLIVGVGIWLLVRDPKGRDRPAARGRPASDLSPPGGQVPVVLPLALPAVPLAFPATASNADDAPFFDGYIWGRLEERHAERQHGPAGGHDHDMFDGDDGFDHDS
jgi:hypothetical protein